MNEKPLHPTIFVIFGITGDLASRKLLPALIALYSKKKLPNRFAVIGFSRRSFTKEEFRELIRSKLNLRPGEYKEEDIKHFLDHLSYEQGIFNNVESYRKLASKIKSIDESWGQCSNKLFHLSVPPSLYEGILNNLALSRLTIPCADETGWTRVLIEKPFGKDLETAVRLDKLLGKLFKEKQIFRIDHYLAKEALQNILAFRFTNNMFEPLWNNRHIDKIHIKLFESGTVSERGDSYDEMGALKDVGQNHMLMMLASIMMLRPRSFEANDVRKERANVLKKLTASKGKTFIDCSARAQYKGYLGESGVPAGSQVETYFRIKASVTSSQWKNVPIYLESGKAMSESKTEIDIYFKPDKITGNQNILTFRIQPDECIKIKFFVKTPGYEFTTEPRTLRFKYSEQTSPDWQIKLTDYEKLIHDAFIGDQTLFASTDEIMASWKFIQSVSESLTKLPLRLYELGAKEI